MVSDLLRERLSPTSEYAQSLIQIQAAYINTNHPAFVSGSTQATREAHDKQQRKVSFIWHLTRPFGYTQYFQQPAEIEAPNGSSALEDDVDDEVPDAPNGTQRSVSSSLPRSRTPISGSSTAIISTQLHRTHGHQHQHQHHSSQPAQAKETFLNFFFGGQGPASAPSSVMSTPPSFRPRGSRSGAAGMGAGAGMVGDVDELALDQDPGKSAAMDMKSLGKHIDAVRYFSSLRSPSFTD